MSQTPVAWTDETAIAKHLASDNRHLMPSADRPPPQHDDREQLDDAELSVLPRMT
jgi:hypothetical protein